MHHLNRSAGHRYLCLCSFESTIISLSLLLFVLVLVVTKPLALQEQEDRRQNWPGQQYPPSYQNIGKGAASWGCPHSSISCCGLIYQGCMETCSGAAERHQTCRGKILKLSILLCRPAEQRGQSALALACWRAARQAVQALQVPRHHGRGPTAH